MTTVNPTSATPASAATGNPASGVGSAALAKSSADFNMFLKLLTTQMQNQDPLSPMDTSQYTQQLVQFSQVEQTIQQTETLKDILSRLTTQDMAQASGFIGRDAVFDTDLSGVSANSPGRWSYNADSQVSALVATISDSSGKVVDTRTVPATARSGEFTWAGTASNGARLPDGAYSVAITGKDAAGNDVKVGVQSIGRISEVTTAGGGVSLGVNGAQLPASKLVKVWSAS